MPDEAELDVAKHPEKAPHLLARGPGRIPAAVPPAYFQEEVHPR